MLAERAAQSAAEKRGIDRRITGQVLAHPGYLQAACVFCFPFLTLQPLKLPDYPKE